MTRQRRLVFGEVADLYDRHRPVYPDALIDDLIALAGLDGERAVLDVGAGTGKATALFAARGIPVVAVEPSAEMAAVARRNLGGAGAGSMVEIELSDFEHWDPRGRRFPLAFAGQAWHWVAKPAGYERAVAVLDEGGILAPFWNRTAWEGASIRPALVEAYEQAAPELAIDGPMHPGNLRPDADADWEAEIAAVDGLGGAEVRYYEWSQEYSAEDYVGLLATESGVRLLDAARREALLDAVRAAILAHGEPMRLPLRTRLCLARAIP